MILNIIDRRTNKYKWKELTIIFEPTCHDNNLKAGIYGDTTEHTDYDGMGYDEIKKCSLNEAIDWGIKSINYVTLYIYDLGKGINVIKEENT